jgi:hypothetical protein
MTKPETMVIYLTKAVASSQGASIGAKTLPVDEARELIRQGVAVEGGFPPAGFLGPWASAVEQQ